eukprot:jgi/Ulvmu1/398/UM001_0405.1
MNAHLCRVVNVARDSRRPFRGTDQRHSSGNSLSVVAPKPSVSVTESCRPQWRGLGTQCGASASLSVTASHALGWLVIAGSWFRSVPQIVRIVRANSVAGISVVATVVETLCYTVIIGYNWNNTYPLSSYGDVFACWIQNALLCATIAYFRRPPANILVISSLLFVVFNWWIISGACGISILLGMQVCVSVVMSVGARLPQIWLNFQRGNTGELSILTFALSSIGNLIRVYTTAVLTSDMVLVFGTASQFVLNGVITAQCLHTELANRKLKQQSKPET